MSLYQNIINPLVRRTVFSCLLSFATLLAVAVSVDDDNWTIKVNGKITEDRAKLEGAVVSLIKNSRLMQEVVTSGNGKFVFVLKAGNNYEIEVSKPGYVRKSITFSTKSVPAKNVGQGFPEFPIEFVLFLEVEGVNATVLEKPVGRIFYSALTDDFTIDMEYNQSIKADINQLNKDIKYAKANARKRAYAEQRELAIIEQNSLSTPNGASDNSIIPEIVVEANSHVREVSVQWSDRQGVEITTGIEMLYLKRQRIREELEHLPAMLVSINTYKDGRKEILVRIVSVESLLVEYKRVTQPWGSKFYFKDGGSITEHIFKLESDLEALLQSDAFVF
ncbi:MAG: carboxypeptidase regulatory-like domain-containing protein [Flavobacteriales bacterium]|nr:carboxypeptidase regulatory-like domain-containing protein [Flavobacteriales bacterium]